MPAVIDIVTFESRGLRRSAEIVQAALAPAFRTEIHVLKLGRAHLACRGALKSLVNRLSRSRRIMIFLEVVPAAWIGLADQAVLVPNQEWMSGETVANLPRCTQVWCKTRYAENIFTEKAFDTRFIGFSSKDVLRPGQPKDYNRFIHVPGKSRLKGTRTIIELWLKHPEWPLLQVVTRSDMWTRHAAANLLIRRNDVPEDELHGLMNECGVHLCPSEAEGFGHYISEALSTRALVITTDAPPMNEMVGREYGLLARYDRSEPEGFGERFYVDPADLERQIETALAMSAAEKARIGEAARDAYRQRDAAFAPRLLAAMDDLLAAGGVTRSRSGRTLS